MTTDTLPFDPDAEQHLIGALFLHHGVLAEALRFMKGSDLFLGEARRIWDACERMLADHGRVSLVLVRDALVAGGLTDADAKLLALDAGNWAASCEDYTLARMWAERIEDLAVRRRMIGVSGAIAGLGYDEPEAGEAVRKAYQALGDATQRTGPTGDVTLEETANALFERLNAGETARGLATGLPRIDEATKGLRPGELTILAARTAHGKTALALQIARGVAGTGTNVAMLSLEMDADSLTERLVSTEAGVPVRPVLEGAGEGGDFQRVVDAIGALAPLPITFSVAPATSLPEVKRTVSRWADVGLCHLLIVDYLQLVGLGGRPNGNRAYEVGAVAQALRDLAQTHKIHVLALAQLNRAVEHRSDPTPTLADLRESGGIEQAADQVLLLWRPQLFSRSPEDEGVAFCHLAKNRSGPLTTEPLHFNAAITRFGLLDTHHQNP